MKYYERAFRYLSRKKVKTLLLFLVLLAASTMILTTTVIQNSIKETKGMMQENTKSRIRAEATDKENLFSQQDIKRIRNINNIKDMNLIMENQAYGVNFNPVVSNDKKSDVNQKVKLLSYTNPACDSAFADQRFRLTDGTFPTQNMREGILINALLAEANGLNLGDEMEFETENGEKAGGVITGFFVSGSEERQDDLTSAVNRTENQIYITPQLYTELFGESSYESVVVYAANPELLGELAVQLKGMFSEKAEFYTSDLLYQQMKGPLEQISKITGLMKLLTIITTAVVVTLLLCMWMKDRAKEFAVLISLGEAKMKLLRQGILESAVVLFAAVSGAYIIVLMLAEWLQDILVSAADSRGSLQISIGQTDVLSLLGIGGILVTAAIVFSMIPILRRNPKTILADMEG